MATFEAESVQIISAVSTVSTNGTAYGDSKNWSLVARLRSLGSRCSCGDTPSDDTQKPKFKTKIGSYVTSLGNAVGTGNIWRYPRITASLSDTDGSLTFILIWGFFLFSYAIPEIVIEYAFGRFAQGIGATICVKFLGRRYIWVGLWFFGVVFFIGGYYQVVVGWCYYYCYFCIVTLKLPETPEEGEELFLQFTTSGWPVFTQMIVVCLTGVVIYGRLPLIECLNLFCVPVLWVILVFLFFWSLTQPYCEVGIAFLYGFDAAGLLRPELWIGALTQNCYDTGCGFTSYITVSRHLSRKDGITTYSWLIPGLNNFISCFNCISIFSLVFSILIVTDGTKTRAEIMDLMRQSGPSGTGLTFTWLTVLLGGKGKLGRVILVFEFLALAIAGTISLAATLETAVSIIVESGIPARLAIVCTVLLCALVGLGSALSPSVLANQDSIWAMSLMISGVLITAVAIHYGPRRFVRVIINGYGTNDVKVPTCFGPIFAVLIPLQVTVLILYWVYGSIKNDPNWYKLTLTSMMTTLLSWSLAFGLAVFINFVMIRWWKSAYVNAAKRGCDPYDPNLEAVLYAEDGNFVDCIELEDLPKSTGNGSCFEIEAEEWAQDKTLTYV